MSRATRDARAAKIQARQEGELCTHWSRASSTGASVHVVIVDTVDDIDDGYQGETRPTGLIAEADVSSVTPGDVTIDAGGTRWIVERARLDHGMWEIDYRREH